MLLVDPLEKLLHANFQPLRTPKRAPSSVCKIAKTTIFSTFWPSSGRSAETEANDGNRRPPPLAGTVTASESAIKTDRVNQLFLSRGLILTEIGDFLRSDHVWFVDVGKVFWGCKKTKMIVSARSTTFVTGGKSNLCEKVPKSVNYCNLGFLDRMWT